MSVFLWILRKLAILWLGLIVFGSLNAQQSETVSAPQPPFLDADQHLPLAGNWHIEWRSDDGTRLAQGALVLDKGWRHGCPEPSCYMRFFRDPQADWMGAWHCAANHH